MSCVRSTLQHVTLTQWFALTYTIQLTIKWFHVTESCIPSAYTWHILVTALYQAQEMKAVTFSNVTVHCWPSSSWHFQGSFTTVALSLLPKQYHIPEDYNLQLTTVRTSNLASCRLQTAPPPQCMYIMMVQCPVKDRTFALFLHPVLVTKHFSRFKWCLFGELALRW
jgi:hypothetical protein